MTKNVTKGILALAFVGIFSQSAMAVSPAALDPQDPWKNMEKAFVIEPDARINAWSTRFKKLGLGFGAGAATWGTSTAVTAISGFKLWKSLDSFTYVGDTPNHKEISEFVSQHKISTNCFGFGLVCGMGILPPVAFAITYIIAKRKIERKINKQTLVGFVKNWKELKEFTPQELHETFDTIAQGYEQTLVKDKDTYLNKIVKPTMKKVRAGVYAEFSEKYSKRIK